MYEVVRQFLAAGEARKAVFWPIAGFTERIFCSFGSRLSRGGLDMCVSKYLRVEKVQREKHVIQKQQQQRQKQLILKCLPERTLSLN